MRVEAHAKVNLTLEVFDRRADGYHALRSLVLPISLADTLDVDTTGDGSFVSDVDFPDDLCLKAARVLAAHVGGKTPGASVRVTKRIPVGGGLGGGSADAAAVLVALNELWGARLSRGDLAALGARVGSDVPSLVLGEPVVMEGRGEHLAPLPFAPAPLDLVLVDPGVRASTQTVYADCTPRLPTASSPTSDLLAALESRRLGAIAGTMSNDLTVPAMKRYPEIAVALTALRSAGVEGASMTGSGSCVFGLVPDATAARRIAGELAARGFRAQPVRTLGRCCCSGDEIMGLDSLRRGGTQRPTCGTAHNISSPHL